MYLARASSHIRTEFTTVGVPKCNKLGGKTFLVWALGASVGCCYNCKMSCAEAIMLARMIAIRCPHGVRITATNDDRTRMGRIKSTSKRMRTGLCGWFFPVIVNFNTKRRLSWDWSVYSYLFCGLIIGHIDVAKP